jgi:hypothetical protein
VKKALKKRPPYKDDIRCSHPGKLDYSSIKISLVKVLVLNFTNTTHYKPHKREESGEKYAGEQNVELFIPIPSKNYLLY